MGKKSIEKKKHTHGAVTPPTDEMVAILQHFSLDTPSLPSSIEENALASGGFPYTKKMKRAEYDKLLRPLQIELLKMQSWVKETGERLVILFEGRDAAGKGGTILRLTQHLNPRHCRVVALTKPTDIERGQWYFQRYIAHMPTCGEITVLDRSWYNRAGVEPVNGFCTPEQTEQFLREAPAFERMLVRDGVRFIKIFLDIGQQMQLKRLHDRRHDPLKQWKLSPIDFQCVAQWEAYSLAFERMFAATHLDEAPWTVVLSNDKLRARLAVIAHVLSQLPYHHKDQKIVGVPDKKILGQGTHFFDQ